MYAYISFLLIAAYYSTEWKYLNLFIQFIFDVHLGRFYYYQHTWTMVQSAVIELKCLVPLQPCHLPAV